METIMMIPRRELTFTFARAGGPGGQNVNKVSSKVLLRWNPSATTSLPEDVKARLLAMLRGRLTNEGDLLITSQRYRDQARNIEDCVEKLHALLQQAARPPKQRKKTKPTRASKKRNIETKRRRAKVKAGRGSQGWSD
jgi:ribosome-associated protein